MKTMTKGLYTLLSLALLCVSSVANAQAQPDTTRILVTVAHLKPEKVNEWRSLQQNEVIPALKKAGITTRTVLETLFGDRPEFITLRPLTSFAEFDGTGALEKALGAKAAATLGAKIQACEVSTQRYIINRQNEFTVGKIDAPIRVTTTYRINSGQAQTYRQFLRDYVLPLDRRGVQENKVAGFSVAITGNGSPEPGLWIQSTYLPNAAALDAPGLANQLLDEAQRNLLNARAAGMRVTVHNTVRRTVPELSY
jgi:hypothetical protein